MEYRPIHASDLIRQINSDVYLPSIQRELVWGPERIERLFDSILADFPIGSFLFWKLSQENKNEWPVYEFIRDYNEESPHNPLASMAGINKDILLVLDGQQRITSLLVGLRGSFRFFYYRWKHTALRLNILKLPIPNDDNPEELTYEFSFREITEKFEQQDKFWYPVSRILDFEDAEDAKADMKEYLGVLSEKQQDSANRLIGRLHNRIHTTAIGNYYEEKSQDYDKVLQVFVRANSGGQPLEYSDLLLATATAKWDRLNARNEIHNFTDSLNEIGSGFKFGKDFVLKACLYLCETLPIQYKVKNFTKPNLMVIEDNWELIKDALTTTVRLISHFGFSAKNVVAPLALLPIAFYVAKLQEKSFESSSLTAHVTTQDSIRRWFIYSTIKNAFGGSSDTTLSRLRPLLVDCKKGEPFPADPLYESLEIEPTLNEGEIERIMEHKYQARYTILVLSLLYPDRHWKETELHVDHIFPQAEFRRGLLRKRGLGSDQVEEHMRRVDLLPNLQILTKTENVVKNDTPFDQWIGTRDDGFRTRHIIPEMQVYEFKSFLKFCEARRSEIATRLRAL